MGTISKNNNILSEDAKELSKYSQENDVLVDKILQNEKETNKILKERGSILTDHGKQVREIQKTHHGIQETIVGEIKSLKDMNDIVKGIGEVSEEGVKSAQDYVRKLNELKSS